MAAVLSLDHGGCSSPMLLRAPASESGAETVKVVTSRESQPRGYAGTVGPAGLGEPGGAACPSPSAEACLDLPKEIHYLGG